VNVPAAALVDVATASVEPPPAETVDGLNVAVAPAGTPLTDRTTGRELPAVACVLTVYVVLAPCTTVRLDGEAVIAKSLRASGVGPPVRPAAARFARANAAWSGTRYATRATAFDLAGATGASSREPTLRCVAPPVDAVVVAVAAGSAAAADCGTTTRAMTSRPDSIRQWLRTARSPL